MDNIIEDIHVVNSIDDNLEKIFNKKIINIIKVDSNDHCKLIKWAKSNRKEYIIIWDSSTKIISQCFDLIFLRIMTYLKDNKEWDVFYGNPTNVSGEINIKYPYPAIVNYRSGSSDNFTIYSSRAYEKILSKKEGLKCFTCVPYITTNKNIEQCHRGEQFIIDKIKGNYIGGILKGGLGNQMFIIAAAFCLAKKNGSLLIFDKKIISPHGGNAKYWDTFFNFINLVVPFSGMDKTESEGTEFKFRDITKNVPRLQLSGYFQHAGFLYDMRNDIQNLYQPTPDLLYGIKNKYSWINNDKYKVSIHIRRGDYVKAPHFHDVPVKYYNICQNKIIQKYGRDKLMFIVFSDDIQWCKKNIKGDIYISGETDYKELYLMSLCHIHVIANSTFSWWGAYLSRWPDEVYVPCKWMNRPHNAYPEGLVLKGWIKVDY